MATVKDESSVKRSVLFSARMRFSPTGANIREEAIQRILEENLAAAESPKGLTETELRKVLDLGENIPILKASDVKSGIQRLKLSKRINEIKEAGKISYVLSPSAREETDNIIKESEERYESVLKDLFKSAPAGIRGYDKAFLKLLCLVFSRLGDMYVKVITGTHAKESFGGHQLLSSSIDEVSGSESIPDKDAFKYGVNRFFRESSPKFDTIKWNMAQNYYITKALGIDEAAQLLSADILNGMSFYLDTNVLIAGLIPEERYHSSFQELFTACKTLNIKAKVTQKTVEELKNVVNSHADLLKNVLDKIPIQTRGKVRSFLLERFLSAKAENPTLSLDEFLANFQAPMETLQEVFDLQTIDDEWFDQEIKSKDTEYLARELSQRYEQMRGKPKKQNASIHDALFLQWVYKENDLTSGKCRGVTLDLSLVNYSATKPTYAQPIVITLDALLQWTTPQCFVASGDRLAEIYSQAIKYQLLPREVFFDLRDFQVFAEMEIETAMLPAEDVESCIRDIRATGATLDPSKAEDREKIGHIIQRYFADPGTKYRTEMERLADENRKLSERVESERKGREGAESKIVSLTEEAETQKKAIEELKEAIEVVSKTKDDAEQRISKMEQGIKRRDRDDKKKRLIHSILFRTGGLIGILLLLWIGIALTSLEWGSGATAFQKLINSWKFFAAAFLGIGVIYPFILGRERMRLLKWWKGENVELETLSDPKRM